jgi:hypothetical protein
MQWPCTVLLESTKFLFRCPFTVSVSVQLTHSIDAVACPESFQGPCGLQAMVMHCLSNVQCIRRSLSHTVQYKIVEFFRHRPSISLPICDFDPSISEGKSLSMRIAAWQILILSWLRTPTLMTVIFSWQQREQPVCEPLQGNTSPSAYIHTLQTKLFAMFFKETVSRDIVFFSIELLFKSVFFLYRHFCFSNLYFA